MKWLSFYGRDSRSDFWICQIAALILSGVLGLFSAGASDQRGAEAFSMLVVGLFAVMSMARRFRDMGVNPWWVILAVVPFVGFIFLLVAGFRPSASMSANPHRRETDWDVNEANKKLKERGWPE